MRLGVVLVVVSLLTGCATGPYGPLKNPKFPLANQMDAEVRIPQHEIYARFQNANAGAAGGGLIGALVAGAIDSHHSKGAEAAVVPVRDILVNINTNDIIKHSIDTGLDRHRLSENLKLQYYSTTVLDDEKNKAIKPGQNILVLQPEYFLAKDFHLFCYQLHVAWLDRKLDASGKVTQEYHYQDTLEFDQPLPKDEDTSDWEALGKKWAQLTPAEWTDLLTLAASETVAMLNFDLDAKPVDDRETYAGPLGNMKVNVERTLPSRSWVRWSNVLFSVPNSALTKS